jgi:hypothetical protein
MSAAGDHMNREMTHYIHLARFAMEITKVVRKPHLTLRTLPHAANGLVIIRVRLGDLVHPDRIIHRHDESGEVAEGVGEGR